MSIKYIVIMLTKDILCDEYAVGIPGTIIITSSLAFPVHVELQLATSHESG